MIPIGVGVDRASATEAVDSGLIPGLDKPKILQTGIRSQRPCLTCSNKRDMVKPSLCALNRKTGDSLTRRPKRPFVNSCPKQRGE